MQYKVTGKQESSNRTSGRVPVPVPVPYCKITGRRPIYYQQHKSWKTFMLGQTHESSYSIRHTERKSKTKSQSRELVKVKKKTKKEYKQRH